MIALLAACGGGGDDSDPRDTCVVEDIVSDAAGAGAVDCGLRAAYYGTAGTSGYVVSQVHFDPDPSGGSMIGAFATNA